MSYVSMKEAETSLGASSKILQGELGSIHVIKPIPEYYVPLILSVFSQGQSEKLSVCVTKSTHFFD